MAGTVHPQEIYRHFKGKLYQVITLATHSETGETLVIYQALYGDYKVYARELSMFLGEVDREKYPDCTQKRRFELVDPSQLVRKAGEPGGRVAGEANAGRETKVPKDGREADEPGDDGSAGEPSGSRVADVESGSTGKPAGGEEPAGRGKEEPAWHGKEEPAGCGKEEPAGHGKEEPTEIPGLDPAVAEFLDAKTYEDKLRILVAVHHRITQDMITTMAVACDVEVEDGDLEERYAQLKSCLVTMEKFECNRLR